MNRLNINCRSVHIRPGISTVLSDASERLEALAADAQCTEVGHTDVRQPGRHGASRSYLTKMNEWMIYMSINMK